MGENMSPASMKKGRRLERYLLILLVVLGYVLYFPISHYTATLEGRDVALAIDYATPLSPPWITVYSAVLIFGMLPLFVVKHPLLFRRVAFTYLAVEFVAFIVFCLFPVHMEIRPDGLVDVDSFYTWGIWVCYKIDVPSNCFPSLHVALATLTPICCWKANRGIALGSSVFAVLISASTMLVKQHYFADVLAGFTLAALCCCIFVVPFKTRDLSKEELAYPTSFILIPIILQGLFLFTLYRLYLVNWVPPWIAH